MTDPQDLEHRTHVRNQDGDTDLVDEATDPDADAGMMAIRLPIASTGEVRNEGDDPLTREELAGMAQQVNDLDTGVFPEHGGSEMVDGIGQYSQFEKLGYWSDGEVRADAAADGSDLLVATARMPDPDTLPQATGDYRQALAILKEQAKRGIPIDASIGWKGDEDAPGGNDLLEASIVGIGADPRTSTAGANPAALVARSAVAAGADPDALVDAVRDAVTDRATYEVGDSTVDITPPEPSQNAVREAKDAKTRFDGLGDCGTGVGEDRGDQILNDEVGPDVVEEVAAYLTSHEDDVAGITDPPTDWDEATWTDGCGPVQYAMWGGMATGTALNYYQRKANEVADARDEELPYPGRALTPSRMAGPIGRNLDDPEFSEGDAVMWSFQDTPVHGRVAGIHEQFTPEDGPTITGEDGEAVYSIHEWDDDVEGFRRQNVAKPQSSLSESGMDMPPASEENFQSMTDDDPADDGGTTDEQHAGDGETRAPEDVGEDDLCEFVAAHYDGVDASGVKAGLPADAEFTGVNLKAFNWFLGDVLDMTEDAVEDMLADAMDAPADEEQGDDEMGDDDEEDEDDDEGEDGEMSTSNVKEEVATLRAEVSDLKESVRSGDADLETPGEDTDPDDTRENEPDGETTDRATDGPDWRA